MPQLTLEFIGSSAIACVVFWLVPRRARPWALLVASGAFITWLDPIALALLVLCAFAIHRIPTAGTRGVDWAIVIAITLFLAVRTGQRADTWFGLPPLIAPVGFGFMVLRLIHYRVELGRGTLAPHGLLTCLNYLLFFPTVTVGPIHRVDDFLRSEARHRWDSDRAARGLRRVLFGYVKVVVLANWLVYNQDLLIDPSGLGPLSAWLFESLQYGLYLYLAFAGYSDIAIGLALILGHEIVENFRFPFLQPNLGAFWRSWHMSLSDWCRRYIFLPALARWRRPVPALFLAMIGLGLWHELSLRFIAWGAWHAVGLAVWRAAQRWLWPRLPRADRPATRALVYLLSVAATFGYVMLGFTLIKEPSLDALFDEIQDLVP